MACRAVMLLVLFGAASPAVFAAESNLQLAPFVADITPPVNQPVGLGFIPIATTVEHPLLAKGVILLDGDDRYVLCAFDWMEVHNSSYDLLRKTLAEAAGTQTSRVAVQTLHQHTAPAIDSDSQALQLDVNDPRRVATAKYLDQVARQLADAVKTALRDPQPLTHVGTSQAKVDRVASNRRIEMADCSIRGRMSSTKDETLRAAPEGSVDPWLKTVSLFNGDRAVAQLHYYATHPQSFYGDCGMGYIGGDRIFSDKGGYEQTYSFAGPCENPLLAAIAELLSEDAEQ